MNKSGDLPVSERNSVSEDDMFDDEQPEDLEEPNPAMKKGYPESSSITFKPILVEGRMLRPKKRFPACNLLTFRRVDFFDR